MNQMKQVCFKPRLKNCQWQAFKYCSRK